MPKNPTITNLAFVRSVLRTVNLTPNRSKHGHCSPRRPSDGPISMKFLKEGISNRLRRLEDHLLSLTTGTNEHTASLNALNALKNNVIIGNACQYLDYNRVSTSTQRSSNIRMAVDTVHRDTTGSGKRVRE